MLLILHTSKTHGKGSKPQLIHIQSTHVPMQLPESNKIPVTENYRFCLFEQLRQYLNFRHNGYLSAEEQFFIFRDRMPVSDDHMHMALKKTLIASGFDDKFYNTRSFRSRRAGDLLELGLSWNQSRN